MRTHFTDTNGPPPFKWPLFRLAFRPLFLFASAFSILTLVLWLMIVNGGSAFSPYGGGYWWHIHEMLFGFGAAIVAGFLLTAVQTWTQQPSAKGYLLIALVLSWAAPRLLMLTPELFPYWLIALTDLIFLPFSAVILMRLVVRVKQWRNFFFGPLLILMSLVNAGMHWIVLTNSYLYLIPLAYTMVMMIGLVMYIMAGRVFPMFTANGTQTQKVIPLPWVETVSFAAVVLSVLVTLFQPVVPPAWAGAVYLAAALSNAVRVFRWRTWVTFKAPLVWSLHLSYWSLVLGFLTLGLSRLGIVFNPSQAIHIITVGAMGGMILAMISRVSLGHSGRPVITDWLMGAAFASINLAMLVRAFGVYVTSSYSAVLTVSAVLWVVAYGLFLLRYTPILVKARADGGPG